MIKYFVILILFVLNITSANAQWINQSSYPTINRLTGCTVIDENIFIAVGEGGLIVRTTNSGMSWNKFDIGANEKLNSIYFVNTSTGWTCGSTNELYKTTNSGVNWFRQTMPGTITIPRSIFFLNENTGWMGEIGIYKTTNGGENWTAAAGVTGAQVSFSFINENTGWSSGVAGNIYKTTNGGTNWTYLPITPQEQTWSIKFFENNSGYTITFNGRILKTTNGGNNWALQYSDNSARLNSIYAKDSLNIYVCGELGTILKTTNGGANWGKMQSNTFNQLYSINFLNEDTGWAAGEAGTIVKTTNAGNNWERVSSGTGGSLRALNFKNTNSGWGIGAYGEAYQTTNGGSNWIVQRSERPYTNFVPFTLDSVNGWIGARENDSNFILRTSNTGVSWSRYSLVSNQYPGLLYFINTSTGWMNGCWKTTNGGITWDSLSNIDPGVKFQFTSDNTGYSTGLGGKVSKTTNGGHDWNNYQALANDWINTFSIHFINDNTGWASGWAGQMSKTTNAGINWTIQNSATIDPLWDVFFLDANYGWACGQNGAFVKTTNGGANWKKYDTGGSAYFGYVYFIDINTGWITAFDGTILKTTNGGTSFIQSIGDIIPNKFYLSQNYPNPFNPVTVISFQLPVAGFVKLKVFDLLGREIANLVNENLSAGSYKYDFNASALPSGIYFYKLETDNFSEAKKMVLVK